jgi:3D (Asp-Asp-Asp) domain-containing protein
MQKGIKFVTAGALVVTLLGFGSHSAGQGKEITYNHSDSPYLDMGDFPRGLTIKRVQKDLHRAKTEAQEHKQPKPNHRILTVEATAYVSYCDTGCTGITATGTNVQQDIYHESGLPIIAVDPAFIPLGSIVEIEGRRYIADDTGGAIKGNRIDVLVSVNDTSKAFNFGRRTIEVKIIN